MSVLQATTGRAKRRTYWRRWPVRRREAARCASQPSLPAAPNPLHAAAACHLQHPAAACCCCMRRAGAPPSSLLRLLHAAAPMHLSPHHKHKLNVENAGAAVPAASRPWSAPCTLYPPSPPLRPLPTSTPTGRQGQQRRRHQGHLHQPGDQGEPQGQVAGGPCHRHYHRGAVSAPGRRHPGVWLGTAWGQQWAWEALLAVCRGVGWVCRLGGSSSGQHALLRPHPSTAAGAQREWLTHVCAWQCMREGFIVVHPPTPTPTPTPPHAHPIPPHPTNTCTTHPPTHRYITGHA